MVYILSSILPADSHDGFPPVIVLSCCGTFCRRAVLRGSPCGVVLHLSLLGSPWIHESKQVCGFISWLGLPLWVSAVWVWYWHSRCCLSDSFSHSSFQVSAQRVAFSNPHLKAQWHCAFSCSLQSRDGVEDPAAWGGGGTVCLGQGPYTKITNWKDI